MEIRGNRNKSEPPKVNQVLGHLTVIRIYIVWVTGPLLEFLPYNIRRGYEVCFNAEAAVVVHPGIF